MSKKTILIFLGVVGILCFSTVTFLQLPPETFEKCAVESSNVPGRTIQTYRDDLDSHKQRNWSYTRAYLPLKIRLLDVGKSEHPFKTCDKLRRPMPEEVSWHKNFYHYTHYKLAGHDMRKIYMAKFYFDNRYATASRSSFVRAFAVVPSPPKNVSDNATMDILFDFQTRMMDQIFYSYLWYENYTEPVMSTCWTQEAHALSRSINNHFYLDYVITCPVPELPIMPTHASLSCCPCTKSNVYLPITFPAKAKNPQQFDIALCMSALYGTVNDSFVPYFVNWMEMLQLLGISEVITNNATIYTNGDLITKAFNHYKKNKFLNMQNFPIVHPYKIVNSTNETERAIANSVSKTAAAECYLTNMHRFWYILYHDIDELVIPRNHQTYAEYFKDLFKQAPREATQHCLAVRSAFSYSFFPVGNPEYPEHLPLLRRTRRWTEEPLTIPEQGYLGMVKSFSHVHYLVAVGNHICRETHATKQFIVGDFLPVDSIVVFHYRDKCQFKDRCAREGNASLHDPVIVQRWGSELQARVEKVLHNIGYFK